MCVVFWSSVCLSYRGHATLFWTPALKPLLQQDARRIQQQRLFVPFFGCDKNHARAPTNTPAEAIFSASTPTSRTCSSPFPSLLRMETKVNLALREDASAKDRLQAMFQVRFAGRENALRFRACLPLRILCLVATRRDKRRRRRTRRAGVYSPLFYLFVPQGFRFSRSYLFVCGTYRVLVFWFLCVANL